MLLITFFYCLYKSRKRHLERRLLAAAQCVCWVRGGGGGRLSGVVTTGMVTVRFLTDKMSYSFYP